MTDSAPYDHRNCTSLFGYSAAVHVRSGGSCELCGAGDSSDFDWWRQLTVEHLIGEGQGGYLRSIKVALSERFPELDGVAAAELAARLDAINTVSACQFCNATTSRTRTDVSMTELISGATSREAAEAAVRTACEAIVASKRADVKWKIDSVRAAWIETIAPSHKRSGDGRLHQEISRSGVRRSPRKPFRK
jgi:hypothetical protein